ncbi:MAG: helix-turn-helix domain-containing protein [Cytophagales bacterium]|nr:helix-turn-helix domain-containing protein [Cytophagales bacterium]
MSEKHLTKLGEYFASKAVNRSQIARRTGLSKQRLSELAINKKTKLQVEELYLIAMALEACPCELVEFLCGHLKDKVDTSLS